MSGFGMDKYNSEAYLRYLKEVYSFSCIAAFLFFLLQCLCVCAVWD